VLHIPKGTSYDLTVDDGTQSLRRYDLVISEFTKGGSGEADTHVLRILKGVASASPADPELVRSALTTQGSVNQLALFRLVMNGLAIEEIQLVAPSVATGEYIRCKGTDATITPTTGEIKQVLLTSGSMISNGRCLSVKNGAVVCAVDGVVEVCGSVYMQSEANPEHYHACYIKQNDVELTPGIRHAVLYGAVSTPAQMVAVKAGDVFTLHCRTSAVNGHCLGGNNTTWMWVRYIG